MSPWMYLPRLGVVSIIVALLGSVIMITPNEAHSHTIEIVIVSIDNCPPCKRLAKELDRLRQLAGPSISIKQVYNKHQELEQQYHVTIRSFPTILVIVDGKVIHKLVGYYSAQALWNIISSKLSL